MTDSVHEGTTRTTRYFGVGFAGVITLVIGQRSSLFVFPTAPERETCRHDSAYQKRRFDFFHAYRNFHHPCPFTYKNASPQTAASNEPTSSHSGAGHGEAPRS